VKKLIVVAVALVVMVFLGVLAYNVWWHATHYVVERTEYHDPDTYTVEHTEYHDPRKTDELKLTDDLLADKNPAFDPDLVDGRPLGDWELNASAAVVRLDCPSVKPDREAWMLELCPSYADAVKAAAGAGRDLLPSANLLDGTAKQFDDGLYAALDLASFQGKLGDGPAAAGLIEAIFQELPEGSPARPFMAAGLKLAGKDVDLTPDEEKQQDQFLARFESDKARSKPIAFYNWTPELKQVWRFFRFLQEEFPEDNLAVPRAVAGVLQENPELLGQYRAVNAFYGKLTNPLFCLPVDALIDADAPLKTLAKDQHARHAAVAIFPPSTSRETELFEQLFPQGVPGNVNLMAVLIRRIRSGEVDLAPKDDSGWYQYQVYALQTMLLPGGVRESEKLLLTAKYKKRLVEAFKALITKRRETHARGAKAACEALASGEVRPRLRVEPCLTFYLRTARAYAFLQNFLLATVGQERLASMHGLRRGGPREPNLADELEAFKQRFYGFYLVGCEDIGMRPKFLEDEPVEPEAAKQAALTWLESMADDPDLACDTRVSVPIYVDPIGRKTRLWGTLGVRLAHLKSNYARGPKVRPKQEGGEWQEVEIYQLGNSPYVIPVDEFAEFEIDRLDALTREEFRKACDQHKTKAEIVEALSGR